MTSVQEMTDSPIVVVEEEPLKFSNYRRSKRFFFHILPQEEPFASSIMGESVISCTEVIFYRNKVKRLNSRDQRFFHSNYGWMFLLSSKRCWDSNEEDMLHLIIYFNLVWILVSENAADKHLEWLLQPFLLVISIYQRLFHVPSSNLIQHTNFLPFFKVSGRNSIINLIVGEFGDCCR